MRTSMSARRTPARSRRSRTGGRIVATGVGRVLSSLRISTRWPGRTEVVGTTVVVIVACFLFGFYLFLVDSGLSWVIEKIFRAAGVVA
jgi:preprotein translocase SecE subunit